MFFDALSTSVSLPLIRRRHLRGVRPDLSGGPSRTVSPLKHVDTLTYSVVSCRNLLVLCHVSLSYQKIPCHS